MDFVSRLKLFMESQNLASTQFADACRIPRPTVSQILNGRNKKVSDELIGKIHAAFPQLSVMWLMFGEGRMVTSENITLSEAQNDTNPSFDQSQIINNQSISDGDDLFSSVSNFDSENSRESFSFVDDEKHAEYGQKSPTVEIASDIFKDNADGNNLTDGTTIANALANRSTKNISSIVVFYDDNTFETFSPTA